MKLEERHPFSTETVARKRQQIERVEKYLREEGDKIDPVRRRELELWVVVTKALTPRSKLH
jgi:hypothetical protein